MTLFLILLLSLASTCQGGFVTTTKTTRTSMSTASKDDWMTSCCCQSNSRLLFRRRPYKSACCSARSLIDDDSEYIEDDDDDDDDEPPVVNIANFSPPTASFGLGRGRSSPSQRKAMGRSGSSVAHVYVCTVCGSESVKWMGRCPTCREWNTLQEHVVQRRQDMFTAATSNSHLRPFFSTQQHRQPQRSWLDGIPASTGPYNNNNNNDSPLIMMGSTPIRITDLYPQDDVDDKNATADHQRRQRRRRERIVIPNDHELNLVLGGGIMPGSLTLVGGDPGVGKSTLLLQMAGSVASLATPTPGIGMGPTINSSSNNNDNSLFGPVWYVSGEENPDQIASRAYRLGIQESELWLLSETHVDSLCEKVVSQYYHYHPPPTYNYNNNNNADDDNTNDNSAQQQQQQQHTRPKPPSLLIIDSIQTMVCDAGGTSAAGGITQVRECVATFLRLAKSLNMPIMLVGHVTKTGDVAGPRTVEHMVDCVLYLEGMMDNNNNKAESSANLRMLRASKNRFGSADEVGVYEMTAGRLLPVSDPSSLFLAHRQTTQDVEGSAIALVLEGRRAMTIEIQALVVPATGNAGFGRRTVDGIAHSRLLMLMGVLQKRCGILLGKQDVYVNVVGRIRLDRGHDGNAGDLAVAVALVSSLTSIPVRSDTAFVGAVDLSGDLRQALAMEKRLQEAWRMGFSRVVTGRANTTKKNGRLPSTSPVKGVEWIQCTTLKEAIDAGLVRSLPKRRARNIKPDASHDGPAAPGKMQDLGLEILDDEDENDYQFE